MGEHDNQAQKMDLIPTGWSMVSGAKLVLNKLLKS